MVIADPHVFASTLHDNGAAFQDMMNSQRKMIDMSEAVWDTLLQIAVQEQADLVLIPGDLTKDGETDSHTLVKNGLKQLNEHMIKTLVIPGNHDIGGNAYSYFGSEKSNVQTLQNAQWWEYYESVCSGLTSKDPGSHSYVAEPLEGVTVLGIDGSHDNAGTGSLSEQTLAWLLAQADAAKAKGNMIIAMSHWQIVEHFDKQSTLESACRMADADALRDSLMHHGVHVVLTGHFHVNGITTYRDTTGVTNDSIVEITTGAPITYPCPYRWLTLSKDRSSIRVETETISALGAISDFHAYSREWMSVHTENLVPVISRQMLNKSDEIFEKIGSKFGALDDVIVPALKASFDSYSDDQKIALVQKYMGPSIVKMYLLHSDANEPDYEEAQPLAESIYAGIDSMIHKVTDKKMNNMILSGPQSFVISMAKEMAKEPVQSLVEDKTHWISAQHADRTDDLRLTLVINAPRTPASVPALPSEAGTQKLLRSGQLLIRRGDRLFNTMGQIVH